MSRFTQQQLKSWMWQAINASRKFQEGMKHPYVGAVVLSPEGELISEGYKDFISGTHLIRHAERVALYNAGERARGGILVTTLEPCVRSKDMKKPLFSSCSQYIVDSGIKTVIFGVLDTSDQTECGGGKRFLQNHGIEVIQYPEFISEIVPALGFCYLRQARDFEQNKRLRKLVSV